MKFRLLRTFDNVLVWCDISTRRKRPYVTEKFRRQVFNSPHGLGHPSHRATKPLINSRFVWQKMNTDIANWCRYCTGCQAAKVSRHNKPVFGKFEELTERFEHVHVDLVGPLPYSDGFKYLLTCVDRFTRWPEAIPIKFESKLWDTLCNQFGITRNRTTSYHPQSNGIVERFHRQLKAAIMAHETRNPWTTTLPAVLPDTIGRQGKVRQIGRRDCIRNDIASTRRFYGELYR